LLIFAAFLDWNLTACFFVVRRVFKGKWSIFSQYPDLTLFVISIVVGLENFFLKTGLTSVNSEIKVGKLYLSAKFDGVV